MPKKFDSKDKQKLGNAKLLYDLRRSFGITQQQLADDFQVTPGTIALWELGDRKIPGPVIRLIEFYEKIGRDGFIRIVNHSGGRLWPLSLKQNYSSHFFTLLTART